MPGKLTLGEARKKFTYFNNAVVYVISIRDILWEIKLRGLIFFEKKVQRFAAYQHREGFSGGNPQNDRVFPLESVRINEFELKHEKNLPAAFIHDGYFADELARSMNALAVTIGTNIYFRKDAYNPASEEGRKLLAHELTHVAQYAEKRITKAVSKEELEEEAAGAELKEQYGEDKTLSAEIGGMRFRFRESQIEKITDKTAEKLSAWVTRLRDTMAEREYLSYLCAVDDWLEGR
jgi:hypothetical protein